MISNSYCTTGLLNDPNTVLLFFHLDKGEQFIHFQLILRVALSERGFQGRQRLGFF
ncbi:MAG: hypothetical protein U0Y68_09955 [Blastocatellia bacterium]